jgi:2-oxoglutarate ferredoxin oxidoreductase subunit gamma
MRKEIQLAGFGWQGVISIGVLIALAAGRFEGKEVAQTQSYGPEARGGACKAEVIISDSEIDYIKTIKPDILVTMSQPALDKYIGNLDPEQSTLIIDNTLVEQIPKEFKNVYRIPATQIAEGKIGLRVVANVIMFGAFARISGLISSDACLKALEAYLPSKVLKKNHEAFNEGFNYAF